jgi:hypothetical protein
MPGFDSLDAAVAACAAAVSANPWLTLFPMPLAAVTPLRNRDSWLVRDGDSRALPIARGFAKPWELLALSAGQPIPMFCEWDGEFLIPMSAWGDGRWCVL